MISLASGWKPALVSAQVSCSARQYRAEGGLGAEGSSEKLEELLPHSTEGNLVSLEGVFMALVPAVVEHLRVLHRSLNYLSQQARLGQCSHSALRTSMGCQ